MISQVNKARVPIKLWAPLEEVESAAIDQLVNTANMPGVFRHVAAMPDVHLGAGATIGSVIATKNAIIPAAVGVDIGCGMIAAKTPLRASDLPDSLSALRAAIEAAVPVGFAQHKTPPAESSGWPGWYTFGFRPAAVAGDHDKALHQLGTLGGGNHFIEVCLDTEQAVWIMLHSGSRGIGKRLADVHIDKAKSLMRSLEIRLADPDLAYLDTAWDEFNDYWRDLQWAQAYAALNRDIMLTLVHGAMERTLGRKFELETAVNCHHNYASYETHFGEDVLVTRKGAVSAQAGELGIIPGSMGAKSYIVRGKGNPESFCSCSHGAGRRMSRGAAKRTFTLDDLERQTRGIECRKDLGVIDEIPSAYKDIDVVMANQRDLVEIVAELKQVLCVKG